MISACFLSLTFSVVLLMAPWCIQGLRVGVSPRRPLLELGSQSQLFCSVSDCPSVPSVTWSMPNDRPLVDNVGLNGSGSSLTFDPVTTDHEGALLCRASCGAESKHVTVRVQVYSFPTLPVIHGQGRLRLGAPSRLTCEVAEAYPTERLQLSWVRRGSVLQSSTGDPVDPVDPGSSGSGRLRSQYSFTPVTEDEGATIGCRATLELQDLQPQRRIRETSISLSLLSPPSNVSLWVSPSQDPVEGRSLSLTCHSDGAPPPTLILTKEGVELQRVDSTPSLTFIVGPTSMQDSASYQCEASNELGRTQTSTNISVRAHPLQLEASPWLSADRGSALVVSCRASGCLHPPTISWSRSTKNRSRTLLQGGRTRGGLSLLNLQDLDLQDQGGYECEAACDGVSRTRTIQVHLYAFPSDPVLEDPSPVLLGEEVASRCHIHDVFSSNGLRVLWLLGNVTLKSEFFSFSSSSENVSSVLRYRVTEEEVLTCWAELLMEEGGLWRSRRTSVRLQIHSPPSNVSLWVSPSQDPVEGRSLSLICHSDGAPPPTLILTKEGVELQRVDSTPSLTFIVGPASMQDSASYQCEASNELGRTQTSTNISVRAPPRNTSVLVLPSSVVVEGQTVTVCCHAVSFPPSAASLRRLTDGAEFYSPNGTFLLANVTVTDSGLYQVNMTNELGHQVQVFSLSVTERTSERPNLQSVSGCILAVSAAAAATAILVLTHLHRAKKTGFYQLASA